MVLYSRKAIAEQNSVAVSGPEKIPKFTRLIRLVFLDILEGNLMSEHLLYFKL